MPKFAANLTMMFNEVPFIERFAAARNAGFTAVEYLFPYAVPVDAVREALHANDLKQVLFNAPPGDWDAGERGIAALSERSDEFLQSIRKALIYGKATSVSNIHVMAGNRAPGDANARRTYRDNLLLAADEAAAHGIGIVIEPLNTRDNPAYHLTNFDEAAEIIDSLNHDNLGLQFDIYHRQILHGDVIAALRNYLPLIAHVQTASVPGRNEPGTGELNDHAIFDELDRLGYGGFVGCEYRPASDTLSGLGWLKDR